MITWRKMHVLVICLGLVGTLGITPTVSAVESTINLEALTFETPTFPGNNKHPNLSFWNSISFGTAKPLFVAWKNNTTVLTDESFQIEPTATPSATISNETTEMPTTSITTPILKPKIVNIRPLESSPSATPIAESPSPSIAPSSTPTPSPTPIYVINYTPPAGSLDADKLFEMSNNYRQTKGLTAFEKDARACEVAQSRAPEISAEIAGGYMHKGIKDRNLPYWNSENIITMRTEEAAFNWWINDYIHRVQIEGNYKYSCVACHGQACVQEFTNFQPK